MRLKYQYSLPAMCFCFLVSKSSKSRRIGWGGSCEGRFIPGGNLHVPMSALSFLERLSHGIERPVRDLETMFKWVMKFRRDAYHCAAAAQFPASAIGAPALTFFLISGKKCLAIFSGVKTVSFGSDSLYSVIHLLRGSLIKEAPRTSAKRSMYSGEVPIVTTGLLCSEVMIVRSSFDL